jgi:hypothetical protein
MKLRYPLALLLVVLISCVSEQDYQDALHDEARYIHGVCTGAYGDYLDLEPNCADS